MSNPSKTEMCSHRRQAQGQGLVEFALAVPIFLLIILGIFDFGRVLTTYAMTSNAVRDALRQAEIIGFEPDLGSVPPYRNCEKMVELIQRSFWIPIDLSAGDLTISYLEATKDRSDGEVARDENLKILGTCDLSVPHPAPFDGDITSGDPLENGDILLISLNTQVAFITPFLSSITPTMPVRFTGQRTIVTELELHADPSIVDTDYDGLDDLWEEKWFGDGSPGVSVVHDDDDPNPLPGELLQTGTDDPDGDGCNNGCEYVRGTNPLNPDTDGDGLTDGEEAYVYFTDPNSNDTDSDRLTDCQEIFGNSDATRCAAPAFINPATYTFPTNPRRADTDDDGLEDGEEVLDEGTDPNDADTDDDTLSDGEEVNGIPATDTVRYPLIANTATYTHPTDPLSTDSDGDNLSDGDEVFMYGTDPNDTDTDSDGIHDDVEIGGYTVNVNGVNRTYTTDPTDADTDNDGLNDGEERSGWASTVNGSAVHFYPDPHSSDVDGDGLTDVEEQTAGTNPQAADTDNDGLSDFYEVNTPGQNPLVIDSGDEDGDFLPDAWEDRYFGNNDNSPTTAEVELYDGDDDPDGDGCDNICEFRNGLDPTDDDTDGDGLEDGQEVVAGPVLDANGIPTTWEFPLDTLPNAADTDADGLNDYAEVITWSTDPQDKDTDNDGVEDGPEVTGYSITVETQAGTVTRSVHSDPTLVNSDGDSLDDAQEFARQLDPMNDDTDADGLTDGAEVTGIGGYSGPTTSNPKHWDTDGDGLGDGFEADGYTLPHDSGTTCRSTPAQADTDGDGLNDGYEYNNDRNPCVREIAQLTITDVTVNESDSTATLTITATNLANEFFSVRYRAVNDSGATYPAAAGLDFTAVDNRISFDIVPPEQGTQTQTIIVPILEDASDEYDETFIVELYNPTSAEIVDDRAVVTIIDNDTQHDIGVSFLRASEMDQEAVFRVSVLSSVASGKPITVNYTTANGTAAAGSDYTATTGTVTIPAGSMSADFTIPVIDDLVEDRDETFTVTITTPSGGNASVASGQGTATATIFDDESVKISVLDTTVYERIGTINQASFTVELEVPVNRAINLTYRTANGTATAPADYTAVTSGTVTIPANTASVVIPVTIAAAETTETEPAGGETFTLELLTTSLGQLWDPTATGRIYNAPRVSVSDGAARENATASFTVTLQGYTDSAVTISYNTINGSATAGTNYTSTTGTHVFPASASLASQTYVIQVPTLGQNGNTNTKTFTVRVNVSPTTVAAPAQIDATGTVCDKTPTDCQ